MSDILIKAFITKCCAHVKYAFYAKKARENGFCEVSSCFDKTSESELFQAYALLCEIGCDGDVKCDAEDFIEGEKHDIETFEKMSESNAHYKDIFDKIRKIDETHLKNANVLLESLSDKDAYVIKKCSLCGYADKSGRLLSVCPKCGNDSIIKQDYNK